MPADERILELTRLWWLRAAEDLEVARNSRRFAFAACFHCQQAVEKAIKALLVYHQADFEKTHDIGQLLTLLRTTSTPPPESATKSLGELTRFAVETRYPPGDATDNEVLDSLEKAERFLLWARGALPKEV
jgi:HEPN domain-containing protein